MVEPDEQRQLVGRTQRTELLETVVDGEYFGCPDRTVHLLGQVMAKKQSRTAVGKHKGVVLQFVSDLLHHLARQLL